MEIHLFVTIEISQNGSKHMTYFTKNEDPFFWILACHKLIADKIHSVPQGSDKCYVWSPEYQQEIKYQESQ